MLPMGLWGDSGRDRDIRGMKVWKLKPGGSAGLVASTNLYLPATATNLSQPLGCAYLSEEEWSTRDHGSNSLLHIDD